MILHFADMGNLLMLIFIGIELESLYNLYDLNFFFRILIC